MNVQRSNYFIFTETQKVKCQKNRNVDGQNYYFMQEFGGYFHDGPPHNAYEFSLWESQTNHNPDPTLSMRT